MSVRRAQQEVSSKEFSEWVAFYDAEPFGDRIADLRAAQVAATVANTARSRDTPPFQTDDFIPWAKKPEDSTAPPPAPETVALVGFGINLTELKASGRKQFVIRRPKR